MQRDIGRRQTSSSQGEHLGTDPILADLRRNWPCRHFGLWILAPRPAAIQFCGLSYPGCCSLYGSPRKLIEVGRVWFRCPENSEIASSKPYSLLSIWKRLESLLEEHSSWGQLCQGGAREVPGRGGTLRKLRKQGEKCSYRSSSFSLNSASEFAFSKFPRSILASWDQ